MRRSLRMLVAIACGWLFAATALDAAEWNVPLAGNAYRVAPAPGGNAVRNGVLMWSRPDEVFAAYVHLDRPARLQLALRGRAPSGAVTVSFRALEMTVETSRDTSAWQTSPLLTIDVAEAGYLRLELRGIDRSGPTFGEWEACQVTSDTDGLVLRYVATNDGNMFYWGRRGPSVHWNYETPRNARLRHAYSELTVPEGEDPVGSYFMANGFAEGYFGMQVNSPTERRVLFSVWSPFQTDNPRDIPPEQRVDLLARGPDVRVGEFGNEGSGGQSYLLFPWQAGKTYGFLTEVRPDGQGSTIYTSWFRDLAAPEWRLIASFRRPKTDTDLRRFHSFLENFQPQMGHLHRKGWYGNVWVRDIEGNWLPCTRARFSVDATGGGQHRLDFAGGSAGGRFFLENGGFLHPHTPAGSQFTRELVPAEPPTIDFAQLPRGP